MAFLCMKDKEKQAFVHSKMEAILFNHEVNQKIELSKELAKRDFKKRNPELCATTRSVCSNCICVQPAKTRAVVLHRSYMMLNIALV
jgi:hypothetical protein